MNDAVFLEHELLTRTGEYVTTVRVPNFKPPVEVILWGERIFMLRFTDQGEHFGYYEGLMWVVPPEQRSAP